MTNLIEPIKQSVKAMPYRPVYRMHRYFARRPYSVFGELVNHYSNPLDIVLDPFCGGGVLIGEDLHTPPGLQPEVLSTRASPNPARHRCKLSLPRDFRSLENFGSLRLHYLSSSPPTGSPMAMQRGCHAMGTASLKGFILRMPGEQ